MCSIYTCITITASPLDASQIMQTKHCIVLLSSCQRNAGLNVRVCAQTTALILLSLNLLAAEHTGATVWVFVCVYASLTVHVCTCIYQSPSRTPLRTYITELVLFNSQKCV